MCSKMFPKFFIMLITVHANCLATDYDRDSSRHFNTSSLTEADMVNNNYNHGDNLNDDRNGSVGESHLYATSGDGFSSQPPAFVQQGYEYWESAAPTTINPSEFVDWSLGNITTQKPATHVNIGEQTTITWSKIKRDIMHTEWPLTSDEDVDSNKSTPTTEMISVTDDDVMRDADSTAHYYNEIMVKMVDVTSNSPVEFDTTTKDSSNTITENGVDNIHNDGIGLESQLAGNFIITDKNSEESRGNNLTIGADGWPVKHAAIVEGDVILGGLMMVHSREDSIICGPIMPQGGIQALEAMLFTLDQINGLQLLPNISLGAHILDDCDKDTYGLEVAVDFIKG